MAGAAGALPSLTRIDAVVLVAGRGPELTGVVVALAAGGGTVLG